MSHASRLCGGGRSDGSLRCRSASMCIVQQPLKSSASSCARRHCRRMPKAWRNRPQRSWVSRMRILTVSFHKSVGWLAASLSQDLASAWARETIPRATEYLELASPRKWTCWRWRSIRTWRLKPGKCLRGADCLFCHAAHRSRGRTIGQKQYSRFQPQPRALLVTCRGLRFQTTFS